MMRLTPSLVVSGALGASLLLQAATAEAGRVRFSGRAHVRSGAHVHRGPSVRFARPYYRPYYRSYYRPRVWLGGSVWVGSYYPRPYSYYYYSEPVPSYYGNAYGSYYPVQPSATVTAPGAVPAVGPVAPARPPLPTFGIGVFAGGTTAVDAFENETNSEDLGGMLRLRLTPGLLLEGELARQTFQDSDRIDRRFGGALVYEFGAYNSFAPFVLAGAGVQQTETGDSFTTTQAYGEVGVGLRLALSRSIHLIGDIRAGRSQFVEDEDRPLPAERGPASFSSDDEDYEDFARARIAAVLYF